MLVWALDGQKQGLGGQVGIFYAILVPSIAIVAIVLLYLCGLSPSYVLITSNVIHGSPSNLD